MKTEFDCNPREIRRRLGLNQEQFWSRIGVTQSGGSRYEAGRRMPTPVKELLRVVHVERVDLSRLTRLDFDLVEYLKTREPNLYEDFCRRLQAEQADDAQAVLQFPFPKTAAAVGSAEAAAPASRTAVA